MKTLLLAFACAFLAHGMTRAAEAPAGFWRFEDEPGFLTDSSGNGRDLAADGTVTAEASGPAGGQAASFAGAGRLLAADAPVWHSAKFTIEAYFRLNAVSTGFTQVIASHHDNTGNQRGWHLAEALGKLRFAKSTDGSVMTNVNSFPIAANHRYYAAAILDADAGRVTMVLKDLTAGSDPLYETRAISGGTFDAAAPFAIGATGTSTGGTSFFGGAIDNVRFTPAALASGDLQEPFSGVPAFPGNPVVRTKADGYKGIWFALGQPSTYGDKYSGGLGTYTTNHRPVAVYAPQVNKTFFTYGGTSAAGERKLRIMVGEYDHATHTVRKPTLIRDKFTEDGGVNDPHDNGCITIDRDGYVWVFVSGRSTVRKAFTYRSAEPYSVDGFSRISPAAGENYTYPQIWYDPVKGFFHLLTRYNGNLRELFFRTSPDGITWSAVNPIAKFGGHYQASAMHDGTVATFFNRHINGNVDTRTDLYYMQTTDWGQTWTTADGTPLTLPLTAAANPARVHDYSAESRLMYGIDLTFDEENHPVLFYLTSSDFRPGPAGEPRTLHTARWTGSAWEIRDLPPSATAVSSAVHNYVTGSIRITGNEWHVLAPTGADASIRETMPKRFWGQGGEVEHWLSTDRGATWTKVREVTENSPRKHGYVRFPQEGEGKFGAFWADGHPDTLSESHLYFATADGTRYWELPYDMMADTAKPVEVNPPFRRWQRGHFNASEIDDPETGGADADPDKDGVPNLVEYGRGTDPWEKDMPACLSACPAEDDLGRYLELSYRKNPEAFDLFQKMETSGNLSAWEDIEEELFEVSAGMDGGALLLKRGHRSESGLPGDRRFYRMSYRLDE